MVDDNHAVKGSYYERVYVQNITIQLSDRDSTKQTASSYYVQFVVRHTLVSYGNRGKYLFENASTMIKLKPWQMRNGCPLYSVFYRIHYERIELRAEQFIKRWIFFFFLTAYKSIIFDSFYEIDSILLLLLSMLVFKPFVILKPQ